jgi:preprotein translocase subunit YajC
MLKRWLIIGLLIAALVFMGGCVPQGTTGTSGENGTTSTLWMVGFLVLIFALFYFTMVRPQRKRQKEHETMMRDLHKGDHVITASGIYGTVESLDEESIVIKVESGATLRVTRGSVIGRRER